MRKWLVGRLIMICIFAAVLCGCTQEPEEGEAAVEGKEVIRLYYTNETATTLQEVEVLLEDHLRAQERIGEIIKKMQAPPEDMFSIIPQGVEISHSVSYNSITEKQEIRLEIDGPYESLTPNMENVFRVGLMKSLIRLENVGSVELYVNTENEQGGKESVRISYLTVDNVIVNEADANFFRDEVELTLYFINENGDKLVEEKRTTTVWISEVIAEEIMNMLIAGPQVEGHKASIPNGTVINQILLRNNVCYVDLSEAFVRNQVAGELTEQLTIYSIVNSLTEYYGVDSVQFLIDGQPREYYKSHVLINTPLIFNEELVETEED